MSLWESNLTQQTLPLADEPYPDTQSPKYRIIAFACVLAFHSNKFQPRAELKNRMELTLYYVEPSLLTIK